MPRLRQVPRAEVTDPGVLNTYNLLFGDKDPVAEPGTATGTPGDWWTVFANAPEVLRHANFGFLLYRSVSLDPQLREIGQTRAGWIMGSQFVYSQHCKSARALGMSEAKIAAISAWAVSDQFSELERAVLAYTDALALDRGRVHDRIFETLRAHLSDQEIVELTYVVSLYIMHAMMVTALRLEFDDVPERMSEVPGDTDAWSGLHTPPAGA
ncbi:MAG TPA: carboxymuconolactone decarboxylase family protein [Acidimicrobiales bacterium]|jgi:alkylhydroperoxidase family enzyme|nr:carboxymuconolactone decarboxylase family protein [Acidimicrobiales bacterium]